MDTDEREGASLKWQVASQKPRLLLATRNLKLLLLIRVHLISICGKFLFASAYSAMLTIRICAIRKEFVNHGLHGLHG